MWVLDTDVLSNLRRRRPYPDLMRWLRRRTPDDINVTVISVMEIARGIALLQQTDLQRAEQIARRFEILVTTSVVLPLDIEPARLLGRIQAVPELRNFLVTHPTAKQPKLGADLAIAVIARQHDATVVTGNFADFMLIAKHCPGLHVFDPFTGRSHPA